jgi:RNA polymerase sigma-70 factor (ECF subfamily)
VTVDAPTGRDAFAERAEAHRAELRLHCYRLLGSFEDAEDLVQETFLRAWRKRATFRGDASFRAWLYGIATNACLDVIRRRPLVRIAPDAPGAALDVPWLQPFPDRLLDEIPSPEEGPESRAVARETVELAFVAAVQLLPPRQRVALLARDVLGWSAAETASLLGVSVAAANSALQRARTTLGRSLPRRRLDWSAQPGPSAEERALLDRYVEANDSGDAAAFVEILREDALFAMPPQPGRWVGAEAILAAWVEGGFGSPEFGELRSLLTGANGQPAVACYHRGPGEDVYRPLALDVLRLEEGRVAEVVTFPLAPLVEAFGLPASL